MDQPVVTEALSADYRPISPRYAISIKTRWEQGPTADWTVFRANIRNRLKSTGLSLSWKNAYGLRDGSIFTFWDSTSDDVAKNILSFLSKDTTLAKLDDRNVISLTFHQHCTASLSAKNFQSYIEKRGGTTFFKCSDKTVNGNGSQKAGPSTVPKTGNNPPNRGPELSITQGHPTNGNNLYVAGEGRPMIHPSRIASIANAEFHGNNHHVASEGRQIIHPSRIALIANAEPAPAHHPPQLSNGVSSDAREGFLPHPSLPPRPDLVRHFAAPIAAQPLRISTSYGHPPLTPQPPQPSSSVTLSPTSLKRSAAALDCDENRGLIGKRAKPEGGDGREIHQSGSDQIKRVRGAPKEGRKQPNTSNAEKKSRQQQKKRETVGELQTELQKAQGALRKVQEGYDKAKGYVLELEVALKKARSAERSLVDENARLADAKWSALEAQKTAEEMRRVSEGKQREAEEKLTSERLSRLAAEHALLDVTSVFHGVNVFTHLGSRL